MRAIRTVLLALSALGSLAFGFLFVASWVDPGYVERTAGEIVRYQVEKKVGEKVEALDAKFLAGQAGVLAKAYRDEIGQIQRQLREGLPEQIAAVIADMRDLDCDCRQKVEKSLREGFEGQMAIAAQAKERLSALIRTQYLATAEKLTREFRIFTGSNALVFILLGVATLARRQAGVHLLPAAVVLLAASALTGYGYLFGQNWLHTLLFNDYVGWAFVGYLAVVFGFLCDLLFNRARVTAKLLNGVFNILSAGIEVLPC